MKKAIVLALALSAGVFASTMLSEAAISSNGYQMNGAQMNGAYLNGMPFNGLPFSITGLDFATISHQGLGK